MVRSVAGVEKEGDAAQEGEVGERVGIAAAGGVLSEGGVAAVMVAVLDSCPVGTAQVDPVFRGTLFPCERRSERRVIWPV